MKTSTGFRPLSTPLWLMGALALPFLTACATTQAADRGTAAYGETVDVGYGEVQKDRLTGSVATLPTEDPDATPPRTLAEMLSRIPGVRVIQLTQLHGGISVRIRGTTNSIVGGEEPLFVLDGMPIPSGNGEIFDLNPNVIESITVLKDAGTTAIYGSRGANGVILIKTKGRTR